MKSILLSLAAVLSLAPGPVWANADRAVDLISHPVGYIAIAIFVVAYLLVILEERIHLAKSKPMLIAAGLIWILVALAYRAAGANGEVEEAIRHNFLEYAELFFFLLVAMTYINAMLERGVFDQLRIWLLGKGFGYRRLFWITGILAFCLSPVADNLTTALIMCAVVMAVGRDSAKFVSLSCINIVVGANAGGAFSPFGDITTLIVWQKGILPFQDFFQLLLPSIVNFLVPAALMHLALPKGQPSSPESFGNVIRPGGLVICALFLLTIANAHFLAALPEEHVLEIFIGQGPLQWDILKDPPETEGYLTLSTAPGWGVELADDLETRFPHIPGPWGRAVER